MVTTHFDFLSRLYFHMYHKHWILIIILFCELGKHFRLRTQKLEMTLLVTGRKWDEDWDWESTTSICFTCHNASLHVIFTQHQSIHDFLLLIQQSKAHQREKFTLYFYFFIFSVIIPSSKWYKAFGHIVSKLNLLLLFLHSNGWK